MLIYKIVVEVFDDAFHCDRDNLHIKKTLRGCVMTIPCQQITEKSCEGYLKVDCFMYQLINEWFWKYFCLEMHQYHLMGKFGEKGY